MVFSLRFALLANAADNCYWRSSNTINAMTSPGWFACNNTQVQPGGAQLCCIGGSQCGEDSICHSNTGYYVGGCTDGSYGDPVCRTSCSECTIPHLTWMSCMSNCTDLGYVASDSETWISWNQTGEVWECCGNNGCDGSPPTASFSAVQPVSWTPVPLAVQSTSTSSPTSTSKTNAATTTSTIASATPTGTGSGAGNSQGQEDGNQHKGEHNNGGLSTGAQVGIGVACGIIGLVLIALVAAWLLRRRRRAGANSNTIDETQAKWRQNQSEAPEYGNMAPHYGHGGLYDAPPSTEYKQHQPQELPPASPTELPGPGVERMELEGDLEQDRDRK
jgi:hypothetical protein